MSDDFPVQKNQQLMIISDHNVNCTANGAISRTGIYACMLDQILLLLNCKFTILWDQTENTQILETIFFHCIDICVTNAYILYSKQRKDKSTTTKCLLQSWSKIWPATMIHLLLGNFSCTSSCMIQYKGSSQIAVPGNVCVLCKIHRSYNIYSRLFFQVAVSFL